MTPDQKPTQPQATNTNTTEATTQPGNIGAESFQEYRERVHANDRPTNQGNKWIRTLMGVFMVILYVGVGVLLLINFFDWGPDWTWCRWVVGIVLIAYGLFRGWRQSQGIGYYQTH